MPVTKQARKKVRQDKRKLVFNLRVKKALKKTLTAFRKNPTQGALTKAYQALDRAAKTNVIHKNRAARLKSRLSKKLGSSFKNKNSSQKRLTI